MVRLYMASSLRDKASNTWSASDETMEFYCMRRRNYKSYTLNSHFINKSTSTSSLVFSFREECFFHSNKGLCTKDFYTFLFGSDGST